MTVEEIRRKLKEARGRQPLTRVAARVGRERLTIRAWEQGEEEPTLDEAVAWAWAVKYDVVLADVRCMPVAYSEIYRIPKADTGRRVARDLMLYCRRERQRRRLSVADVAHLLDVDESVVSQWEKLSTIPKLGQFIGLSDVYTLNVGVVRQFDDAAFLRNGPNIRGVVQAASPWSRLFLGELTQLDDARAFVRTFIVEHLRADEIGEVVDNFVREAVKNTASGEPDGYFVIQIHVALERVSLKLFDRGEPGAAGRQGRTELSSELARVGELADRWGIEPDPHGRIVWATFDWEADT